MALSTRRKKQIVYGLGFVIVFVGVIWTGQQLLAPAPPAPAATPTPTPAFQPITIEDVSTIQHTAASPAAGMSVDIVVRLRNPNPRAGVAQYPVTLHLIGTRDQVLQNEQITTYVLPGAIMYAMKLGVPVAESVSRIEVEVPPDPKFATIPASVSLPSFNWSLRERTTKTIGAQVSIEQKGVVTNTSGLDWQFVEVSGVAVNAAGAVTGAGQTFVGELRVGEQREFTLQWPATPEAISRVVILPTTNIYLQENIVRAIGDPSLLR